jgi:hypothetical protein
MQGFMTSYRLFNIEFRCEFELPELPEGSGHDSPLSVKLGSEANDSLDGFERRFEFTDSKGELSFWSGRKGDDYQLVFPGFAHYRIVAGREVRCVPENDCPFEMVRHLLLNQVIPRILGNQGDLVVHASAVFRARACEALAFLGHSGFGKSTLASSFHRNGFELISDDGMLVCLEGEVPVVFGGMPGMRLLPDARDAVFGDTAGFRPVTPYSIKRQLTLKPRTGDGQSLAALFVLNDPSCAGEGLQDVRIEPMAGTEAAMAIIQNQFVLDPTERPTAVKRFHKVGAILAGKLPVYRLEYPRDLERLNEVRAAIEECVAGDR